MQKGILAQQFNFLLISFSKTDLFEKMKEIYFANDDRFCYDKQLRMAFDTVNKSTRSKHSPNIILKKVINFLLSENLTCCHWKTTIEQNNRAFYSHLSTNQAGVVDLT